MKQSYSDTFNEALEFVFKAEGGLSDDVEDAGGITKYGISIKFLKEINPKATSDDIVGLTKQEAKDLYYRYFWLACKCDKMPRNVAFVVFDTAVNCGCGTAIKLLQKCFYDIAVDGVIGNETLQAVKDSSPDLIVDSYLSLRTKRYKDIVAKHPRQRVFINGWLNRVDNLAIAVNSDYRVDRNTQLA